MHICMCAVQATTVLIYTSTYVCVTRNYGCRALADVIAPARESPNCPLEIRAEWATYPDYTDQGVSSAASAAAWVAVGHVFEWSERWHLHMHRGREGDY